MIAVLVSCGRIWTLALRHIYLLRGSWPRILELVYWPAVQIVLWGFISVFLRGQSSFVAHAFGVLLAGVMLWDLMFRGQLGVSISFFEEMWSRNLGNLFVSPLRPWEMIAALLTMSVVRTLIAMVPASILAILFFHFSIYSLGWPLLAFFVNLLVFGWAIGLAVSGLVMRVDQPPFTDVRVRRHRTGQRGVLPGVNLARLVASDRLDPAARLCV